MFQERLLSPRILHLNSNQIFWECNELVLASECFPYGIPQKVREAYGHRPFHIKAREHRPRREIDGHTTKPAPYEDAWNWIVIEYSNCCLTFPAKDKLIAILGIARRLSQVWDDEYVAGYFRSDILWHLLWTRDGKDTKCCKGGYRASS